MARVFVVTFSIFRPFYATSQARLIIMLVKTLFMAGVKILIKLPLSMPCHLHALG
jgi:hypothetical protein